MALDRKLLVDLDIARGSVQFLCSLGHGVVRIVDAGTCAARISSRVALRPPTRSVLACLVACLCWSLQPAVAADFTVDSTTDGVDAVPGDGACTTAGGVCTLRAAIMEANALAGADAITIPDGVYSITIAGIDEQAAAQGDLDITDTLTLSGAGRDRTIVDGEDRDRVFDVIGDTTTATFSGLTIRNGTVAGDGGGLLNRDDGTVHLMSCGVSQNWSTWGGGLDNNSSGTMHITNCIVSGNYTRGPGGGALNNHDGTLTVTDSLIVGNQCSYRGAGLNNNSNGTMTVVRSIISGNLTEYTAGGIQNNSGGTVTVLDSTVSHNVAGFGGFGDGGGIENNDTGSITISGSTIHGNVSFRTGGGLRNGSSGTINATNVTISGNSAPLGGGGVHNESNGGVTLVNATVAENGVGPGTLGGGLHEAGFGGAITITNTLVVHSTTGGDCVGTITSGGNNLDSDGTCVSGGSDLPATNPLLGPLGDNGGAVPTHALLPGSPAIDHGSALLCPASDARGLMRPSDGDRNGTPTCDIGAFEFGLDCNGNHVDDAEDLRVGTSGDCDQNGVPDECQADGDGDGIIDACEQCAPGLTDTAAVECLCQGGLPAACEGLAVPDGVTNGFQRACAAAERGVAAGTGRKAKRLLAKGWNKLTKVGRVIRKPTVVETLTPECVNGLERLLADVKVRVDALRAGL